MNDCVKEKRKKERKRKEEERKIKEQSNIDDSPSVKTRGRLLEEILKVCAIVSVR